MLRDKHKDAADAYEVMESLEGLFGKQSSRAKYATMKAIANSKQKPRTFVCEYVLKLVGLFNEVKMTGGTIDTSTQVDLILELLSTFFTLYIQLLND